VAVGQDPGPRPGEGVEGEGDAPVEPGGGHALPGVVGGVVEVGDGGGVGGDEVLVGGLDAVVDDVGDAGRHPAGQPGPGLVVVVGQVGPGGDPGCGEVEVEVFQGDQVLLVVMAARPIAGLLPGEDGGGGRNLNTVPPEIP
jgi:hypothetical protein